MKGGYLIRSSFGGSYAKRNVANQSIMKFSHTSYIGWNGLAPVARTDMRTIRKALKLAVIEN